MRDISFDSAGERVIAEMLQLDEPIHIMPEFGPEHVCSRGCWCHPACTNEWEVWVGEHKAYLFVHNAMH